MPTLAELDDKTFAILAVNKPDDLDAIFAGKARCVGETLSFCNEDGDMIPISEAWLARIKPTPDAVKDLLMDCEFVLKIEVGTGEPDQEAFVACDLEWPTECDDDEEDDEDSEEDK